MPAGSHTVEFSYMPKSFVIGMALSFGTACSLVCLYLYYERKRIIAIKESS
jgi:uncharacterized membrane protein YfhO